MMHLYKLIVTDMDGTLLNSIGEIPPENLKAVQRAVEKGVEFAIVTGRPYVSVKGLLKSNNFTCSVIGCNGAQVTDEHGKLVKTHYINKNSLINAMKKAEENDVYYQLYDDRFTLGGL
jgi:HAD superfamily hydrolase (TIGR01484 family)